MGIYHVWSITGNRSLTRGFTLMEMLLVMTIAALVMAVAPPLLSAAMPSVQLRSTTREVAAALRQVRSRAITTGQDATLELDLEQRRAILTGSTRTIALPAVLDLVLVIADQEATDTKHGRIRFYADGTSTGGRVTIRYGDNGYAVDVDWLTGRIQISAAE